MIIVDEIEESSIRANETSKTIFKTILKCVTVVLTVVLGAFVSFKSNSK